MPYTNRQKAAARAAVSIFETGQPVNNYSALAVLRDGAGISYGSHQATHGGGALYKIVRLYCKISKDPEAVALQAYLPLLAKKGKNAPAVIQAGKDSRLKQLLIDAGRRPDMRFAQERIFDIGYMDPAEEFCNLHGFTSTMALAVVFDSKIQGSFGLIEGRVRSSLKNEKTWCKAYCEARQRWLATTKINPDLKNTVYRPKGFLSLIAKGNWNLDTPFVPRIGSPVVTEKILETHLSTMEKEDPMVVAPVNLSGPDDTEVPDNTEPPATAEPGEDTPDNSSEPEAPPVPVAPTPPTIVIPPAQITKPDGPKAWAASVQGWWAALGLSGISFGSVLSGAATSAQTVKFLLILGAVGLAFAGIIWVVYMGVRAFHLRAREREAHQLNLRQLEIYSDKDKNNVKVESPVPKVIEEDGRSVWQKIFFKKGAGENE